MSFKVFYTVEISEVAGEIFRKNGGEITVTQHFFDVPGYIEELKTLQPDAILCRTEPITAEMMDAAGKGLKVIGKQGVGLDNIDLAAASERGIKVVYTPGQNAQSVAEQAIFLMLGCARRFVYVDKEFRRGNYEVRFDLTDTYELKGQTLGIIGCGAIGRIIAGIAKNGFEMNVIGYDPFLTQDQLKDIKLFEEQDDIFRQADFISLHLPALPETIHSIGMNKFKLMKRNGIFINCSRGEVVVEEELMQALNEGVILGAGLDVTEQEPLPLDSPLYTMDSVLLTPHTAASTTQSVERCCTVVANDIVAVINGQEPKFWGNKPKS